MKKALVCFGLIGLMVIAAGCGTNYRMQQGALIGAGVGAVVGHDIGEDTEGTLIGAAENR